MRLASRRFAPLVSPALAALLFVLAWLPRAAFWRSVFEDGRVVFAGNDAYYHARRVFYTLAHFPEVLDRDPYLAFPWGGEPIWPPLFDGGAALLARLWGAAGEEASTERLLAWIPALLGAATVVWVACVGRRHFGSAAGWVAGVVLALLPAHVHQTRVGFFDHHGATVALAAVLLGLGLEWFARTERDEGESLLPLGVATGAVAGAALLVWPGALLDLALLDALLALLLLTRPSPAEGRSVARSLAALHATAGLVVAPFALGREWEVWGGFSAVVLSSFQPWLCGTLALAFAALALAWRRAPSPLSRAARGQGVALAGAVAVAASAPFASDLAAAAGDAWAWLAREESFQAAVAESRPLFRHPASAWASLSGLLAALPLSLLFLLRQWRRGRAPGLAGAALAAWTGVYATFTLGQMRFAGALAVGLALVTGCCVARGAAGLERRGSGRPWRTALPLGVLALLLLPAWRGYEEVGRDLRRWLGGEAPQLGRRELRKRMLLEVAASIRQHTPATSGWLQRDARPEYGVLSRWSDGHLLRYVSRRPMVVDNFGDDLGWAGFELAAQYYTADETRASAILDELGVRYVVFEHRPGLWGAHGPDSMLARLYFADGALGSASVSIGTNEVRRVSAPVRALERHRLVWEGPEKPWQRWAPEPENERPSPGEAPPGFKLYEHVAGALLRGAAPAGARVEVRLPCETNRGRRFEYVAAATADARGHWQLRWPYATGSQGPVRTARRVSIRSGPATLAVAVDEEAVQSGRTVLVPPPDGRQPPPARPEKRSPHPPSER